MHNHHQGLLVTMQMLAAPSYCSLQTEGGQLHTAPGQVTKETNGEGPYGKGLKRNLARL